MSLRNNQIAIVHGTASPLNELSDIIFRNHADYAIRHGYMLQEFRLNPNEGQLWTLYQMFANNTGIRRAFWIDSEAVFTNLEFLLTEHLPIGKIVMACDIFGPSADCLWLENCPEVVRLLWAASRVETWIFEGHHPGTIPCREQMALRYLSLHPPYQELFTYVEQRVMKSYLLNECYSDDRPKDDFGQWQAGDFILHLGGLIPALKVSTLESILNPSSKTPSPSSY